MNPRFWFSQLKSKVFIAGSTLDTTKYYTLVGSIESDVLNAVSHITKNAPNQNVYEAVFY